MTYAVTPEGPAGARLVVELLVVSPPGLLGRVLRPVLPLGDLIVMRRQLLNLKALAESTRPTEIAATA